MLDRFNRNINYMRISVTDRCNLRCRYCMPAQGIELMDHKEIISFEEIVEVVKEGVRSGIKRIRLTGGEPLVRKGIVTLVALLKNIEGIEEISMTTNGTLLDQFSEELAAAGLGRVNISLDTMDPEKYQYLTRGGDITAVFRGIKSAIGAKLTPVKINCVVRNSADEADARAVEAFAVDKDLKVQFIHLMDLESGKFSKVEGGNGGDCKSCNRIRLTANGNFKSCLFNQDCFNIRQLGIENAFKLAIENKPQTGTRNKSGRFYNIGG